jgi:PhnB protein
MPLENQSWGDRYGELRDPFGHVWSVSAPIKATRPRRKT